MKNDRTSSSRPTRRTSTPATTNADGSPFEMLQKIFLEPLSSCYAEGAYGMVEDSDTREWSLESSHAAGSAMSGGSDRSPRSRSGFALSTNPGPNGRRDEDEESEVTLNGLTDDAHQHQHQQQSPSRTSSVAATTSSWSDAAMSRDHSSSSRSGFGITTLRDMPSFSASSVATGSPGRLFIGGSSATPSFSEDSLMSEYESKLPNINTIRRPINPAMIPP